MTHGHHRNHARGAFSLAEAGRFLEGFAPARYHGHAPDGAIRLAFPADDGHTTAGAAVRQAADGTVLAELTGDAEPAAARDQLARIAPGIPTCSPPASVDCTPP